MTNKVAVVISGCGVYDGAEIYETTLTLLRLSELNIPYQVIAPNKPQLSVINHLTGEEVAASQADQANSRNILEEAARLARGDALDLAQAKPEDYAAVILPGGFGVAKNFSDFASKGAEANVDADVEAFVQAFYAAKKPIGLMCIAPAITAKLVAPGILCTIGNDATVAGAIASMGGLHKSCAVDEILVDNQHLLVTTPAYMLAENLVEAKTGIFKLVDKVAELAKLA